LSTSVHSTPDLLQRLTAAAAVSFDASRAPSTPYIEQADLDQMVRRDRQRDNPDRLVKPSLAPFQVEWGCWL
jgi:hypothetical protein